MFSLSNKISVVIVLFLNSVCFALSHEITWRDESAVSFTATGKPVAWQGNFAGRGVYRIYISHVTPQIETIGTKIERLRFELEREYTKTLEEKIIKREITVTQKVEKIEVGSVIVHSVANIVIYLNPPFESPSVHQWLVWESNGNIYRIELVYVPDRNLLGWEHREVLALKVNELISRNEK